MPLKTFYDGDSPPWDNTPRPRLDRLPPVTFGDPPEVLAAKIEEFFDRYVFPERYLYGPGIRPGDEDDFEGFVDTAALKGQWEGPKPDLVIFDDLFKYKPPPHPNCKCELPPEALKHMAHSLKNAIESTVGKKISDAFSKGAAPLDAHVGNMTVFSDGGRPLLFGFVARLRGRPAPHFVVFTAEAVFRQLGEVVSGSAIAEAAANVIAKVIADSPKDP